MNQYRFPQIIAKAQIGVVILAHGNDLREFGI